MTNNLGKNNPNYRHGMRNTPFWSKWRNMKTRCLNKKMKYYCNYGGRGIKICEEWMDFKNFYNDMYKLYIIHAKKYSEKNTTLDRIDVNGNYNLENCKWSTMEEQNKNKRSVIHINFNNRNLTLSEWAKETGLGSQVLYKRIFMRGWPIKKAFNTPNFNN